jgi:hypothetical protein
VRWCRDDLCLFTYPLEAWHSSGEMGWDVGWEARWTAAWWHRFCIRRSSGSRLVWASSVSMAVVLNAPVMASSAIHCTFPNFPAVTMDPLQTSSLSVE